MRVLVIPEDPRNDKYILKPLFSSLFKVLGKQQAKIKICEDPCLGGIGEALKSSRIQEIIEQHQGMTDIFILCVDRDGKEGRRTRLNALEKEFDQQDCSFIATNAWEEIEIWVLAGVENLPQEWKWEDVRTEVHVKEKYFDKLVQQRDLANNPGGGRKALSEEAARHIPAIRSKCSEDFDHLARCLADKL